MYKKISAIIVCLFWVFLCACNTSGVPREYYWDTGVYIDTQQTYYYFHYLDNLGGNLELFYFSIYNEGKSSISLTPSQCVIIGNNDELFFYNRRATIIHNEHVSTSLKINPHTEAFPVIAFNLPNDWQDNNFKLQIEYKNNKFVYLNLKNDPIFEKEWMNPRF